MLEWKSLFWGSELSGRTDGVEALRGMWVKTHCSTHMLWFLGHNPHTQCSNSIRPQYMPRQCRYEFIVEDVQTCYGFLFMLHVSCYSTCTYRNDFLCGGGNGHSLWGFMHREETDCCTHPVYILISNLLLSLGAFLLLWASLSLYSQTREGSDAAF